MAAIARANQEDNVLHSKLFIRGGIGYVTSLLFTSANPIAGAVYSAIIPLVRKAVKPFFNPANPFFETICSFGGAVAIASLFGRITILQALAINVLNIITLLGLSVIFPFLAVGGSLALAVANL